jgi:hypothetical protein
MSSSFLSSLLSSCSPCPSNSFHRVVSFLPHRQDNQSYRFSIELEALHAAVGTAWQ